MATKKEQAPSTQTDEAIIAENQELKSKVVALQLQLDNLEKAYNELAATPVPPAAALEATQPDPVEINGKLYQFVAKKINIRKIGERTALDIMADEQTYPHLGDQTILQWLVANNSLALKEIESEP